MYTCKAGNRKITTAESVWIFVGAETSGLKVCQYDNYSWQLKKSITTAIIVTKSASAKAVIMTACNHSNTYIQGWLSQNNNRSKHLNFFLGRNIWYKGVQYYKYPWQLKTKKSITTAIIVTKLTSAKAVIMTACNHSSAYVQASITTAK